MEIVVYLNLCNLSVFCEVEVNKNGQSTIDKNNTIYKAFSAFLHKKNSIISCAPSLKDTHSVINPWYHGGTQKSM